jgi:hypothetical protein
MRSRQRAAAQRLGAATVPVPFPDRLAIYRIYGLGKDFFLCLLT